MTGAPDSPSTNGQNTHANERVPHAHISNATYLNRAIKGTTRVTGVVGQIQARLNEGKPVQGIDVVSGATFSSRAIIDGYNNALAQAQHAD